MRVNYLVLYYTSSLITTLNLQNLYKLFLYACFETQFVNMSPQLGEVLLVDAAF